ncbi:MAG: GNAT family N-acetyltransferase [Gammaproteobacteria bacterium]
MQDLEQLVTLFDGYRQFYGKTSDPPLARRFLSERISRDQSVVLIAEDSGGAAAGFAQLFPSFSSVRAAPIYILNDLFVAPVARRRGVGVLLLQAAAEMGRSTGAVRLKLSTATTNLPAQRLYEKLGWKRDDEFYEYGLSLQDNGGVEPLWNGSVDSVLPGTTSR